MHWEMLGPLVVCGFAMGVLLGGAEVATVAFSDEHGHQAARRPDAGDCGRSAACWPGVVTGAVTDQAVQRDPVPLGAARARPADAAAAVRRTSFVLLAVFLFLAGLRDLPHADRQLRVDRGDGAGGPAHRGHDAVHHRARRGPGAGRGAGRAGWSTPPGHRRATGCRWSPGLGGAAFAFARSARVSAAATIAHRIVRVRRRAGGVDQHPLGHREVGQQQLAPGPHAASATPPTPRVRAYGGRASIGSGGPAAGTARSRGPRACPPARVGRTSSCVPQLGLGAGRVDHAQRLGDAGGLRRRRCRDPRRRAGWAPHRWCAVRKLSISATWTQRSRCGSEAAYAPTVGRDARRRARAPPGWPRPSSPRRRRCRTS